jgi:hypothetical protein
VFSLGPAWSTFAAPESPPRVRPYFHGHADRHVTPAASIGSCYRPDGSHESIRPARNTDRFPDSYGPFAD